MVYVGVFLVGAAVGAAGIYLLMRNSIKATRIAAAVDPKMAPKA